MWYLSASRRKISLNSSTGAPGIKGGISIPIMGLTLGEIFNLGELAKDCAGDGRYEFLFVSPVLPISGAVASPTNPLAIK